MVRSKAGIILVLASFAAYGSDLAASLERQTEQAKPRARAEAIQQKLDDNCTRGLKEELTALVNSYDSTTGRVDPYIAWKVEELYKTCSALENPSPITKQLLEAVPQSIKNHATVTR